MATGMDLNARENQPKISQKSAKNQPKISQKLAKNQPKILENDQIQAKMKH